MGGGRGKLTAAARWLFERDSGDATAAEDPEATRALLQAGVPEHQVAAIKAQARPSSDAPTCRVWAWHLDAMKLLQAMRTQWRVLATAQGLYYAGLDYAALPAAERGTGLQATGATFEQLQTMEIEARRILNTPAPT